MILLSIDFETTGLDVVKDRPIEVGAILYSTGQQKCLESAGYLVKSDVPISEEITGITGITQAAVNKFGFESEEAFGNLTAMAELADAYIGQNVIRFDERVYRQWGIRLHLPIPEKLWIDTRTDLPGVEGKHLGYMAADDGFLNMFPHSALSDCQTVLKLLQNNLNRRGTDYLDRVVERAKSPTIVLQAHQNRADNELAKKRKFRWNPDYKIWWKTVKEIDLEQEVKDCKFDVSKAGPEILIEKLWYD